MTSETKKFIEPKDIIGVRLGCRKCGAILLIPFPRPLDLEHLRICPHCHIPWTQLPNGGTAEAAILHCIEAVRTLNRTIESDRFDGFSLMLEIKDEKLSETK